MRYPLSIIFIMIFSSFMIDITELRNFVKGPFLDTKALAVEAPKYLRQDRNESDSDLFAPNMTYTTISSQNSTSKRQASIRPRHSSKSQNNFTVASGSPLISESTSREKTSNATMAVNGSLQNIGSRGQELPTIAAQNISIVVQLSGELGNQLSKIAYGKALQFLIRDTYNISTTLILRAQERGSKWLYAMKDVKAICPKTRSMDFRQANNAEFSNLQQVQLDWLGNDAAGNLHMQDCLSSDCVHPSIQYLYDSLQRARDHPPPTQKRKNDTTTNTTSAISIPHIYADSFLLSDSFLMDRYYQEIKEFFTFDDKVCAEIPQPNETVLHIRNFLTEMPRRGKRKGFEELSPDKVANELLSNLKRGDKVAITSRFTEHVLPYVKALEERGLVVRVVEGQTGLQDFCFLMRASRELIGVATSTYVTWAGLLGDAKRVRLYSVDSPDRRAQDNEYFWCYNYTINHQLKARFSFELYKAGNTTENK